MNNIVFINPPYERIAAGYDFVRHITNRSPSLGLLYLAAVVRAEGYRTSIIESDIENISIQQVAQRVIQAEPEYIGITLFTVGVWNAVDIVRRIKLQLPQIKVIVGGPHISSMAKETMERFSEFDIAVIREGEQVIKELLPALDLQSDLNSIKGIIFRDQQLELVQTPPAPSINDLDSLPLPAWDLLPNFPNSYLPAIYDYPQAPVATLAASRGCPFLCKFCDTSTFGAKVRANSAKMVFQMMKTLQHDYGIRHIQFVDDLFLASRIRTLELCSLLIESELNMTWSCTARVDTVKPDVLKEMKNAGCWEISFGLETGSNELLQKMEKAARVEKSTQAVQWTYDAGIRCKGLFMLGYPGETLDTITKTKKFVRAIPMTTMNLSKFTPYPGSPIYRELYGVNIQDDHWKKMNGMNFLWAPEGLDVNELDRHYQAILKSFYIQHRVIHHYAMMSLKNPDHLKRLARFGWGFLQAKMVSYRRKQGGLLVNKQAADNLHL